MKKKKETQRFKPGTVAHSSNPSYWRGLKFEVSLGEKS
jgi:hypothetical protein